MLNNLDTYVFAPLEAGGKSLVFNTVADVLRGVTICICPLLSLGADQAQKLLSKSGLDTLGGGSDDMVVSLLAKSGCSVH